MIYKYSFDRGNIINVDVVMQKGCDKIYSRKGGIVHGKLFVRKNEKDK